MKFNLNRLNSELEKNGLPTVDEKLIIQGGGGYGTFDRIIIGGEGAGLIGNEKTNDNYKINISGGYGEFLLGYKVIDKPKLTVYPKLGIGYMAVGVEIEKRNNNKVETLTDAMTKFTEKTDFVFGGMILDLSLNLEYMLSKIRNRQIGGMMIEVEGGYKFMPLGNKVYQDEIELASNTKINTNGYYVTFKIGGGGFDLVSVK